MKILIAGANGSTGLQLAEKLAAIDHDVYGMIRESSQAPGLEGKGVRPVLADLEATGPLPVRGMDAVAFCAGSGGDTGADKTLLVDMLGAWKLIEACEEYKVPRFLMLSAMNVETPDQGGASAHYYAAKLVADKRLQMSSLDYTIIRPGGLTNEQPTGKVVVGTPLREVKARITRADVAEVMAHCLEMENTVGKTFDVLNGETLIMDALKGL